MIYDDYIAYADEYRARYGENTVVLMQVGDFFELYGVQNETDMMGADMYTIGDICNLTVTRKNKSILENSRSNPLMAGFPLHALSKHSQALLDHGYTVVIIRQVTPPPNVRREVTEILSPSTTATPHNQDSNYLLVYQWERYPNGAVCVGIAGADVSTGHTFAYEVASSAADPMRAYDEAFRMLQAYQPREVVLCGDGDTHYIETLLASSAVNSRVMHKRWGRNGDVCKVAYQNEVLAKTYGDGVRSMLSPIERVGLDKYDASRAAFVWMIRFIWDHNELVVKRLRLPEIIHDERYLTLEYNSAVQLNVLGFMPGEKPLISLLNKCCTAPGSREFKRRLLAPLVECEAIRTRYDRVEHLLSTKAVNQIRKGLKHVVDIERLVRRMQLGTLSPIDWHLLHGSFQFVKGIAEYDGCATIIETIGAMERSYMATLLVEECAKYTLADVKGSVFQRGVHTEIDDMTDEITAGFAALTDIADRITSLGDADACLCRLDSNERDGYFLQITRKRWDTAGQRGWPQHAYVAKPISAGSSVLRLHDAVIEDASDRILKAQRNVATIVVQKFKEYVESFLATWEPALRQVIEYVVDVDVAANNAFIAAEFGYCRPILDESAAASYLEFADIRHPIIEQLTTSVEYVKNDVHLRSTGMLLYGINASGKSSLMKAVGLNIIMAQAGMYVAATKLVFSPFRHVFTRITSMDNIYRGMSTFVVEMAELRNILQRCDARSLVLGDELCAGTESVSAIAIVSAGIDVLVQKRCCFIFATHLHEIEECDGVSVCHMHIRADPDTGKITYDRKLVPGRGSPLYGLEVCESLGMPREFLDRAHVVRKRVQGVAADVVAPHWSRYNKEVCVDMCKVCGTRPAEETHHISPQESASEDGFVAPGTRVHRRSNLVPLCRECHVREHHGNLRIQGYVQTSDGIQLAFEERPRARAAPPPTTFEDVVRELGKKYEYDVATAQWYTRSPRRRCKVDTVVNVAHKTYKYKLTEDERHRLPAELASSAYT